MENRKRSLFYERTKKAQLSTNLNNESEASFKGTDFENKSVDVSLFGNKSYVLKGDEAEEIHNSNLALLSSMSSAEIEEQRQKLLEIISPAHLNFLKRNRQSQTTEISNDTIMKKEFPEKVISEEETKPTVVEELFNSSVHMDVYESDKIKWMHDIPDLKSSLPPNVYDARFDFNGDLMPYVSAEDDTYNKGLHHHGEEPHRPGYSIQELYHLTRSSFIRQRVAALNTLAAILEKDHILSVCLETALFRNLLDSGLYLILRFSLDENQRSVYVAALRAITSLLWKPVDMHYLMETDAIFGDLKKPGLNVTNISLSEKEINEMKDEELIHVDLIKGALRTDILYRFRYLLHDPELEITDLYRILKCLTRIVYHSYDSALAVVNTDSLLERLFYYFRESNVFEDTLYPARFVMLIRLISCQSVQLAAMFIDRWNILPTLLDKVGTLEAKSFTGMQCIRLLHTFLHYGLAGEVTLCSPILCRLLESIFEVDGSNVAFADAVIALMITLFEKHRTNVIFLTGLIMKICNGWLAAFLHDVIPTGCSEQQLLKLLSNAVYLLNIINERSQLDRLVCLIKNKSDLIISSLTESSFILNATKKDFLDNLPSLCVPLSIVNLPNYQLLMRSCFTTVLTNAENFPMSDLTFLLHRLWKSSYIQRLLREQSDLYRVTCLWPARFEVAFLCDLIFVTDRLTNVDEVRATVQHCAFVLSTFISLDDAHLLVDLFERILFNRTYYRNGCDELSKIMEELPLLSSYYLREFNLINPSDGQRIRYDQVKNADQLIRHPMTAQSALPINWYYVPLLKYQSKENSPASSDHLKPALKWIYLLENVLPDVMNSTMPFVTRYCSLASLFFYEEVFLEITDILNELLATMLRTDAGGVRINFNESIPGISSFYDFYVELCAQFGRASYCNPVFGMFLLIPLQQQYSAEYKKLVWGEQSHVLRLLSVPLDRLLVPLENYLKPCEKNVELLKMYLIALAKGYVRKIWCPILYEVALFHVSTFIVEYANEEPARVLKDMVEKLGNIELKETILNYYAKDGIRK